MLSQPLKFKIEYWLQNQAEKSLSFNIIVVYNLQYPLQRLCDRSCNISVREHKWALKSYDLLSKLVNHAIDTDYQILKIIQ